MQGNGMLGQGGGISQKTIPWTVHRYIWNTYKVFTFDSYVSGSDWIGSRASTHQWEYYATIPAQVRARGLCKLVQIWEQKFLTWENGSGAQCWRWGTVQSPGYGKTIPDLAETYQRHARPVSIFVSALGTLKIGLQTQGHCYKTTPTHEVNSSLSQIRTNFVFAAYAVNLEKTNAGIRVIDRQSYNLATSGQWTSLFRGQAIIAYSLDLSLRDDAKAHVKILSALWWASPSTWLGFCACYVSVWLINTWDIGFFACRLAYVSLRIT